MEKFRNIFIFFVCFVGIFVCNFNCRPILVVSLYEKKNNFSLQTNKNRLNFEFEINFLKKLPPKKWNRWYSWGTSCFGNKDYLTWACDRMIIVFYPVKDILTDAYIVMIIHLFWICTFLLFVFFHLFLVSNQFYIILIYINYNFLNITLDKV